MLHSIHATFFGQWFEVSVKLALNRHGHLNKSQQNYLISQTDTVPLTSCPAISKALPVGLCDADCRR